MTPPAPSLPLPVLDNHTRGRDLAGALAVEQVAGVDSVQQEAVAGIALTVGPDRSVAQAGVDAGAAGELGVYTGREDGDTRRAARRQRDGFDLRLIEHIAVGGVDSVEQGIDIDFNRISYCAHGQLTVQRYGSVGLHQDSGNTLGREALQREGYRVFANREDH